jgi:hypothetical protein
MYALVSVVPARDRVLYIFVTYAVVPVMILQSQIRFDRQVECYCKDVCDSDCIEDAKTQLAHLETDEMGLKIVALCKATVSAAVLDNPK